MKGKHTPEGIQIIRIGLTITAVSMLITHTIGSTHEFMAFFMGMGCALTLTGAGKRLFDKSFRSL
jgi:hypothetical protein